MEVPAAVVPVHVTAAVLALIAGPMAIRDPNGTPGHRAWGRAYLVAWALFATTGLYLGRDGRTSPFEVLTVLGAGFVVWGLLAIRLRRRIGRGWRRSHYRRMLASYAFVAVATVNQLLIQAGLEYPLWVFIGLALTPFLILPPIRRRLDQRFGFAEPAG